MEKNTMNKLTMKKSKIVNEAIYGIENLDQGIEETKPSLFVKSVWMVMTIFSIMSLMLAGCSSPAMEAKDDTPVKTIPTEMQTTQVSMDVKDQKSEVQNTDDSLAEIIADGTYTDVMEYTAPSGLEKMNIVVTVENDIVTAVTMEGITPHQKSAFFQKAFAGELPKLVIGKKIDEIDYPRTVAGSSLTSAAFKEHLKTLVVENPAG